MKTAYLLAVITMLSVTSLAQNYKFGKVSEEELSEKVHPLEKDANAAILYREYRTYYPFNESSGFTVLTEVFERIKIYNKEGYDWASKRINLYRGEGNDKEDISGLKAVTYYLDASGKIQEEKLRNNGIFEEEASKYVNVVKFTMPNVQEGCVIELKYTIKSPFIADITEYRFQEKIPVNYVDLRFDAPEYFNYKTHQKGWLPLKIDTDRRERNVALASSGQNGSRSLNFYENITAVELKNVPALKEEAYAGNLENYSSSLKFELSYTDFPNATIDTYSTSWEAVTKSIYNSTSFGGQLDKNSFFKDDVDAILTGITDPQEKMIRIFEFVKQKVNWNQYTGVVTNNGIRDAYKDQTGNVADINLLLTAMFRYARLKANPILVSTKDNGIPILPTRNGFNYVIAGVETNNGIVLFDATNKMGEANLLQPKLLNWQGRMIREDGSSEWISLTPQKPAVQNILLDVTIDEDDNIVGSSQNLFTGHFCESYRGRYANLSAEEVHQNLKQDKGEIDLSNIEFENLQVLYQPVKLSYDFETTEGLENIGGKLYFSPLMFLTTKENPFKLDVRNYPIDFQFSRRNRYMVKLKIPEGYKVESIPENAAFALVENAGTFRYMVSQAEDVLQISVELSINEAVIPATIYDDLKKFYQLLIDKEKEKVVLSKV